MIGFGFYRRLTGEIKPFRKQCRRPPVGVKAITKIGRGDPPLRHRRPAENAPALMKAVLRLFQQRIQPGLRRIHRLPERRQIEQFDERRHA